MSSPYKEPYLHGPKYYRTVLVHIDEDIVYMYSNCNTKQCIKLCIPTNPTCKNRISWRIQLNLPHPLFASDRFQDNSALEGQLTAQLHPYFAWSSCKSPWESRLPCNNIVIFVHKSQFEQISWHDWLILDNSRNLLKAEKNHVIVVNLTLQFASALHVEVFHIEQRYLDSSL